VVEAVVGIVDVKTVKECFFEFVDGRTLIIRGNSAFLDGKLLSYCF